MDYTFRILIVIALIAVFWYIRKKKLEAQGGPVKKSVPGAPRPAVERPVKPAEPPEAVYANLRKRAFETSPQSLGQAGDVGEAEAYALIMEMGIADTVLTLACFADGDAGLYYRSGGGMKGGGSHENIRKAAKELMVLAQKALPGMTPATDTPLPDPGQVRFYALTPKGLLTAEVNRESLGEQPQNPFSSLFYSGQEVVAQMRQVQAQKAS